MTQNIATSFYLILLALFVVSDSASSKFKQNQGSRLPGTILKCLSGVMKNLELICASKCLREPACRSVTALSNHIIGEGERVGERGDRFSVEMHTIAIEARKKNKSAIFF